MYRLWQSVVRFAYSDLSCMQRHFLFVLPVLPSKRAPEACQGRAKEPRTQNCMIEIPPPHFHVRSVSYSLRSGDGCEYVSPPPLEFKQQGVKFRLAAGVLVCEMTVHFSNVEDARAVID